MYHVVFGGAFQFFCGLSTFAACAFPKLDMGYRYLMNLRTLKQALATCFMSLTPDTVLVLNLGFSLLFLVYEIPNCILFSFHNVC